MTPGIDTGGGGISGESTATATSGNNGNTSTSSADRVSKQFINIGNQGAAGLDLNSYLGASNAGFYNAIMGEQKAEVAKSRDSDRWLPYAGLAAAVLLGLGFMLTRGR